MPPTSFEPDQKKWLRSRLPLFWDAKAMKTTTSLFFPGTIREFKSIWPFPPPTDEEIAEANGVRNRALAACNFVNEKRITTWYYNHAKDIRSQKASSAALNLSATKPRLINRLTAYHNLTYESQWKDTVVKEYKAYQKKCAAESTTPIKYFTYMNNFMRAKFHDLNGSLDEEINKYRHEQRDEKLQRMSGADESQREE
ncbi:hypothetical protein BJ165DRAFT_1358543 [Panaeolus papilionaceus]|nr:hypothetical protein BJ165DRAFT_1358543 [Panaeolus papilionaceus]